MPRGSWGSASAPGRLVLRVRSTPHNGQKFFKGDARLSAPLNLSRSMIYAFCQTTLASGIIFTEVWCRSAVQDTNSNSDFTQPCPAEQDQARHPARIRDTEGAGPTRRIATGLHDISSLLEHLLVGFWLEYVPVHTEGPELITDCTMN